MKSDLELGLEVAVRTIELGIYRLFYYAVFPITYPLTLLGRWHRSKHPEPPPAAPQPRLSTAELLAQARARDRRK